MSKVLGLCKLCFVRGTVHSGDFLMVRDCKDEVQAYGMTQWP